MTLWDELEQYAEQIVEKMGKYGFDMAVKETTLIFCVFLLGGGGDNYRYYKRNPCSMHIKMDA